MRYGFTTGSCATAASKAATYMLLTGKLKQNITIQTPKGILFHAEILEITRSEKEVTCAVKKDGGDDPDITSGALIFSTVSFADEEEKTLKKKYKINLHILEACNFRCLQGCGVLRVDSEVCAGMPD